MSRPLVPALLGVLVSTLIASALVVPSVLDPARATGSPASAAPDPRPNIVFVLTDDMRDDDLAYLPFTRRFFGQGVRFRNSFSTNPMCCPARASILTGQLSHNHRVVTVEPPWGFGAFDDSVTIATALQRSGYQTGYVGKYLNGYGIQRSKVTRADSSRYVPPGWDEWRASLDDNRVGVPGGTYHYFDTTLNVNGHVVRNKGEYSTDLVFRHGSALVDRFSGKDAPFFLYLNTVAPHFGGPRERDDPKILGPYTPARPAWVKGRFDAKLQKSPGVPRFGVSPEADRSDKTWPIRSLPAMDRQRHLAVRELARQRAESLYVVDARLRQLVGRLRASGELENTVFVFSSDNGHFLGEHAKLTGKLLPYEPSFRVPLLVRAPGGARGDRFGPVGSADLAPTLLEIAGATDLYPTRMDGRSFWPMVGGDDRPWTSAAYYEAVVGAMNADRPGLSGFGVRTSRWKFVLYNNGKRELYDLAKDPHELTNLVVAGTRRPKVLADLTRVTLKLKRCAGGGCRAQLPRAYRRTASQAARDYARQAARSW